MIGFLVFIGSCNVIQFNEPKPVHVKLNVCFYFNFRVEKFVIWFIYIFHTTNVNANYSISCMDDKCSIKYCCDSLTVSYDYSALPVSLKNLTVYTFCGTKIPQFLTNFTKLQSLQIWDSTLVDFSLEKPMRSLQNLDLSRNLVFNLNKSMLQSYPRLQYLNLSNNNIKNIEDYAFTAISSIKVLDLSLNYLRKLSAPLSARPLLDLTVLRLDNNRLEELSEDLFDTLFKLELLSLAGNYLKIVTERIVRPMYYLEELQLQDNYLHSIALENQKLQRLNLSGNNLDVKNISGLQRCRLTELDLSRNPLGNLNSLKLVEMEYLETLTMNYMRLLSFDTFNGPKGLRVLSLRNNDYSNISRTSFTNLSRLNLLQIDGNRLHTLDLNNLPTSLTYIGLNNNEFKCSYLDNLLKTLRTRGVRLYLTSSDNELDKNIERETTFIQDVICFIDEPEAVLVKSCKIVEDNFEYAWHTTFITALCLSLAVIYVFILWLYRHELKKIRDKESSEAEEVQSLTFHDLLSKDSNEY